MTQLDKMLSVHIRKTTIKRCSTKALPIQVARNGSKCVVTASLAALAVTAREEASCSAGSQQLKMLKKQRRGIPRKSDKISSKGSAGAVCLCL